MIGSMVDGLLDEAERQHVNLMSCRSRPHVLDDYTVERVLKVYSDQADDVGLYEEQLLTVVEARACSGPARREVDRLSARIPVIRGPNRGDSDAGERAEAGHDRDRDGQKATTSWAWMFCSES